MASTAAWAPPKLDANGHFTSQADIDAFKTALFGPLGTSREAALTPQQATPGGPTGLEEHGAGSAGFNYDPTAVKNNQLARQWGHANGFWTDPSQHGGLKQAGDTLTGFGKDVLLSPPVLAAATAGIGSALGAGAGTAAGADAGAEGIAAGQAAGLTADQLMAQSVAGLSIATPAETAAALGIGTDLATAGAAGAGTQFGGTAQSAAGDAGATGGGSKGAAAYFSTAKDIAGLALTGLGLGAAVGAVGPGASQSPPDATPPPQDQVSSVDQQGVAQADNAGQRFPNLGGSGDDTLFNGASGIDPFMLNLGRAKLLGQ